MKNIFLVFISLFISSCVSNTVTEHQRADQANQWLHSYHVGGVTVDCPSKDLGAPFCDVIDDGVVVFWLSCHKEIGCYPLKKR